MCVCVCVCILSACNIIYEFHSLFDSFILYVTYDLP